MNYRYKTLQNLLRLAIILGALVLVIFILINKSNSNSSSGSGANSSSSTSKSGASANLTNPYAILPPASVAPKVAECNEIVGYSGNGVPAPLQCSNGNLNIAAWNALSAQEPKVMSLGYSPSTSDIQSAVCSDINAASSDSTAGADNAIETGIFQISALYYGWNFGGSAGSYISKC